MRRLQDGLCEVKTPQIRYVVQLHACIEKAEVLPRSLLMLCKAHVHWQPHSAILWPVIEADPQAVDVSQNENISNIEHYHSTYVTGQKLMQDPGLFCGREESTKLQQGEESKTRLSICRLATPTRQI